MGFLKLEQKQLLIVAEFLPRRVDGQTFTARSVRDQDAISQVIIICPVVRLLLQLLHGLQLVIGPFILDMTDSLLLTLTI